VFRFIHAEPFAQASARLDVLLGSVNTAVLLTSSLTVALAVNRGREGRQGAVAVWLLASTLLAIAFLGIKGAEYHHKFQEHLVPGRSFGFGGDAAGPARLFFGLYFIMTGLHAVHVLIGIALLGGLAAIAATGRLRPGEDARLECAGLYWHFVDIVWIFLFPMLYLVGAPP
jgi:cytochrome c oxidase subunit III